MSSVVVAYGIFHLCCDLRGLYLQHMESVVGDMWDQLPSPGIKPRPLLLRAQSLSQWTTREIPYNIVLAQGH